MTAQDYTSRDVYGWRRLVEAVEVIRRQVGSFGAARPAAIAELRRATDKAGKCRYPASIERDRMRLMAWWKICGAYVNAPDARNGLNAPLFLGLGVVKAIVGEPEAPPPSAAPARQVVNARLPYTDN